VAEPCLAKTQHVVIAERADEAKRLGEEAHRTWNSHIHHLTRKAGRPDVHNTEAYSPDSAHPLMTGTPAEVTDQLGELIRTTTINTLLCVFSFGDLAPQAAMRSLELFGSEVMPKLRG
jgi:alkanesulfonate monooxygenase SsuD/methylene tetrahydromethanopterin reductase-like flavin-dependent oxidoreductase (luciferase family)